MAIKGGKWEMSDAEFERQFAEATRLGKAETATGVYAVAARYDKLARRIVVELANGMSLLVPARLIQGLQAATAKELAEIEILGAGSGLYWPQLAVDIGVTGLLAGGFGTKTRLAAAGRPSATAAKRTATASAKGPGLSGRKKLPSSSARKRQRAA